MLVGLLLFVTQDVSERIQSLSVDNYSEWFTEGFWNYLLLESSTGRNFQPWKELEEMVHHVMFSTRLNIYGFNHNKEIGEFFNVIQWHVLRTFFSL